MSQQARPILDIAVQATAAISYARAVNVVAGAAALGAIGGVQATVAGQKVIGIAKRDAALNAFTELTCLGTATCEAGAAIAIGSRVQCDASGRVITATAMAASLNTLVVAAGATAVTSAVANGAGSISGIPGITGGDPPVYVFGTALQAASAAGDFIEVLICP